MLHIFKRYLPHSLCYSLPSMSTSLTEISERLTRLLGPKGFECHPFLVGWYNELVADKFALDFPGDTLAYVVLSQPSMFEKTFLPYLQTKRLDQESQTDPIDQSILEAIKVVGDEEFLGENLTILHDFELHPNRRPKVLVQTAAHVSGAVRFFQPDDVKDQSLLKDVKSPKIYSVCLHPRFGGWFAIRAVIVFEQHSVPSLTKKSCDLRLEDVAVAELLTLYNDHWQDWRFRDVIESEEKYSKLQQEYFSAKPSERKSVIHKFMN